MLETLVCLYIGRDDDRGDPLWTGTLREFWAMNEETFEDDELATIEANLANDGMAFIGGGAMAEFTLVDYQNTKQK